jgi:hypothetical protein
MFVIRKFKEGNLIDGRKEIQHEVDASIKNGSMRNKHFKWN